MRLLPYDKNTIAFDDEPIETWDQIYLLSNWCGRFVSVLWENKVAVLLILVSFLLFTEGGNRSLFLLPEELSRWALPHHMGHEGFPYHYESSAVCASAMIGLALWVLFDEIEGLADIGKHNKLPDITFTMLALLVSTYVLVEAIFGKGKGSDWASDYVIAFVAAWALRMLFGHSDYKRAALARRSRSHYTRLAEKSFQMGGGWEHG